VVNDRDFEVWRTWGAQAWPTVAVIDPAGNVVGGHSGEGVYPVLQPVIDSLVAEFDDGRLDRSALDLTREAEGLPQTILSFPGKVHADPGADRLFIADTNHHRIVVARISDGEVTAVYGSGRADYRDGPATGAAFSSPQGLGLSPDGTVLYVADTGNHAVRAIDLAAGETTTVLGTGQQGRYPPVGGPGPETAVRSPWDLTVDGATIYVAMAGSHQIWTLDLESGRAEPFAGNGAESTRNGPRLEAELAQPSGVARDAADNLYFADSESSAIRVVRGLDDDAEVDIVVGTDQDLFTFGDVDGTGTEALLQHPLGVSVHDGLVYVADTYNSKIKVIDPATDTITTLLGSSAGWADGTDPRFYEPGGIHAADGRLYIADTNNHTVRIVDLGGLEATTLLLKGIERFTPAASDDDYRGSLITLPATTIAPGAGVIELAIELPPGHKVNEDAPSSVEWIVSEGSVALGPDADRSLTGTTFPVEFPADFAATGTVTADVNLIWCADDAESLCFIEQVRITAPFEVAAEAGNRLVLAHTIALPDLGA
jgi:DNA-binding beta-propeller fold protein YncE